MDTLQINLSVIKIREMRWIVFIENARNNYKNWKRSRLYRPTQTASCKYNNIHNTHLQINVTLPTVLKH